LNEIEKLTEKQPISIDQMADCLFSCSNFYSYNIENWVKCQPLTLITINNDLRKKASQLIIQPEDFTADGRRKIHPCVTNV
jgi:hypothetical protein